MEVKRSRKYFSLQEIENYIRNKEYPDNIDKNNFGLKSTVTSDGLQRSFRLKILISSEKRNSSYVLDRSRQLEIVRDVHRGIGDFEHAHYSSP